jgi:hypothetical protein
LQPTFRRNISPPSSGPKKIISARTSKYAGGLNRVHGVTSQKMILFKNTRYLKMIYAVVVSADTTHRAPHGDTPDAAAAVGTGPHLIGANSVTIVNI